MVYNGGCFAIRSKVLHFPVFQMQFRYSAFLFASFPNLFCSVARFSKQEQHEIDTLDLGSSERDLDGVL